MNTRSFDTLTNLDSEHIWLKISDSDLKKAHFTYSNQTGKHHGYLNSLVISVFLPWIEQNWDLTKINLCANKPEIWEFVNGSSITINFSENGNSKRLILIPSEAIDTEEFTIPQEWVDIPTWAGDYYLPVQLELESEEKYLHIWGFVSRETVKKTADFDPIFREYFVSVDNIINNLDLLYSAIDLCEEKGEMQSLPELSTETAQKLITKLSEVSPYSPRLDVNFPQWAALLNNEKWLTKLYQKRNKIMVISDWLEGIFEENLLTWQQFMEHQRLNPAFLGYRILSKDRNINYQKIRELYQKQNEVVWPSNLPVDEALVYLLNNTQNQTIAWESSDLLLKIAPNNPHNAIRRILDLGVQLKGNPLSLMIAALPQPQQKVAVLLRVYPMGATISVPGGLGLQVLDENGQTVPRLEVFARHYAQVSYIQLYFRADLDTRFAVRISLDTAQITEYFTV